MARQQQHTEASHRVNLRLNGDSYEAVKRLAAHSGTTVPGFVQQSIEAMLPGYLQLLVTLDQGDMVTTEEEGHDVLERLRDMAVRARAEADRLDNMVTVWQGNLKQDVAAVRAARGSTDELAT